MIQIAVILLIVNVFVSCSHKMKQGLTGYYYKGVNKSDSGRIMTKGLKKVFKRIDKNIDFWDGTANYSWNPLKDNGDMYTVVWKGFIKIDKEGQYGFGTISDDGSEVWIDNKLVVDNSEYQWYDWEDNISEGDKSGEKFPKLILKAGYHKIVVKFYEKDNYDGIKLFWLKPESGKSIIPYTGSNFKDNPPKYNKKTNWEIIPPSVLFTK